MELECADCGQPFEVPEGKPGPKPKKCPDCKGAAKSESSGESAPNRSRSVAALENNLRAQFTAFSAMLTLVDPWIGAHCMKNVEHAAKVHANLAATNPKIRKALERGVEMAGWGPVLVFWMSFGVPLFAHLRAKRVQSAQDAPGAAGPAPQGKVFNFPGRSTAAGPDAVAL